MTDPPGPPATREECWARLDRNFFPFFKRVLAEEDDRTVSQDQKTWEWFIEYLTGPMRRRMLWEEARGPYCLGCDGEDGEFAPDHAFSPRDKSGMPPCECKHLLSAHSKGEKGENNPMYSQFEMLTRGKHAVPGMGPVAPLYDYDLMRILWQIALEFEQHRAIATNFFGVTRKANGVP